jgi:hypothetical protein
MKVCLPRNDPFLKRQFVAGAIVATAIVAGHTGKPIRARNSRKRVIQYAAPYRGARVKAIEAYRGRSVLPIRNVSIERAQRRPSRIAQTTSDWPRRMSPAENTFGSEVW